MLYHSVDLTWYQLNEEDSFFLEGWCISTQKPMEKIGVWDQEGKEVDSLITWKMRPDIKKARPDLQVPDTPGFQLQIPHSSQWMDHLEYLEIAAVCGGEKEVLTKLLASQVEKALADNMILYQVDLLQLLQAGLVIQGWFIDQMGRNEILVLDEKGEKISCELYRTVREDALAKYKNYAGGNREIGFTVKIPVDKIPGKKIRLCFCSTRVKKEYLVDLKVLQREATKGGRLYNCLRPGLLKENLTYIRKNGWVDFAEHVRKTVSREATNYTLWVKKHRLTKEKITAQKNQVFAINPKISIVIPLYETPVKYLKQILDSILTQTYGNLELCLADGSPTPKVEQYIRRHYKKEKRIVYKHLSENGGISQNTNEALALATGDYIMLSDHDDVVEQGALFEIVKAINENPELDLIYTDEDKITMDGKSYFDPNFKPDFNPFMLESNNYICHIFVVRTSIMKKTGGFRKEFDGAQDYDLILRCWEETTRERICHIPKVLYHWRSHPNSTATNPESKRYAYEAGAKALDAHFQRIKVDARAEITPNLGIYRIHRQVKGCPLVSIIIPTKDHVEDLEKCLRSVTEKTTYPNYEILVVENNSTQEETFAYYRDMEKKYPKCRLLTWEKGFNYAAINNFASAQAKGEYLLFLNNDVELITEDWIQEMLGICQLPQVGITGARLYFPDETIQHAGVVLGLGGVAGHIFSGMSRYEPGYAGRGIMAQNYSAVTAACMMMKKSVFQEVEGFDEKFQVAFNDVDLCMKTTEKGYQVVFTPWAQLYHYESKSRGMEDTKDKQSRFYGEVYRFESKWGKILKQGDPYYNPNLSLKEGNCSLADHQQGGKCDE